MRRREFLRLGGFAAAVAAVPSLAGCGGEPGQTGQLLRSAARLPEPFSLPFARPPVARPVSTGGGTDLYRITARRAEAEILPGLRTPILGYDGVFPGPTVEARSGRPVSVEHVNDLPVPMVVHLHGGVVPAGSDGYATDLVLPRGGGRHDVRSHGGEHMSDPLADVVAGSRRYEYPHEQEPATLWYHDHRMDFTGPMVYRGLAGFHLVRDDAEEALGLPAGDRELPLMIADRAFAEDGSFDYPALDASMTMRPGVRDDSVEGVLGDVVLVNGVPWPEAEVDGARHRLRILNASNARRYRLYLDPPPPDGPAFVQIGSDGGLLGAPAGHDRLTVAPGERYDVVVDFGAYPAGTRVRLANELGGDGTRDVMRFVVARRGTDPSRVPPVLREIEPLATPRGTTTRSLVFRRLPVGGRHGWAINDEPFDPARVLFRVPAGETEVWRLRTDLFHPVHVHLAAFQVLGRRGGGPGSQDAGWKDTLDLGPSEGADIAVRFPAHPGRYMIHCHNLEHEDMAMMTTFEVV